MYIPHSSPILLIIIPTILLFLSQKTQALFQHGRFSTSALYNVPVGLDEIQGTVVAFADFNSDKYTDVFVLSENQTVVNVYTWHHKNWRFEKSEAQITIKEFLITNILPGDFNYDGKLDVLVMGQRYKADKELFMRVYLGNGDDAFDENYLLIPSAKTSQPIPFDYSGNMTTDLLGYMYENNDESKLSLWKNLYGSEVQTGDLFEVSPIALNETDTKMCKWAEPHSNAFVDLNDLFVTCQENSNSPVTFQIWTNSKQNGFEFSRAGELPKGAGQVSFADMDGDGTIDMVFPVCTKNRCEIHVTYNKQIPLCSKETSKKCRQSANLCVADDNFQFDLEADDSNIAYSFDETIKILDSGFKGTLPVPIRIGDYNLDGYPDLLVISDSGHVSLLQSIPCNENCSKPAVAAQRRTFSKVFAGAKILNSINKATAAAFLDLDEDGTLDIMVLESTSNSDSTARNKPFGVNYPGATFKFTVLDTSGHKRANQVAQYSQAGYVSLQAPYSLFGLGRTNNYVEELFVGTTRNQSRHYSSFSGVIPNSQLIIVPYQPSGVNNPSTWSIKLYIHPGDWIPWVLLTLVSATVILAVVVFGLNWAEKREDELEKQKALHVINFDAL
ncbi:6316_t:CDS:10 [Ambispora gerdemannii]|uniref:6316_t:CDS:1 n=1 Tax=Ambispora gerdemannii TaxID=144530 RepID=A0A9N8V2T0_9GLOM|nr:6316_t:CDS:10 [Ambispora gerdemannii]